MPLTPTVVAVAAIVEHDVLDWHKKAAADMAATRKMAEARAELEVDQAHVANEAKCGREKEALRERGRKKLGGIRVSQQLSCHAMPPTWSASSIPGEMSYVLSPSPPAVISSSIPTIDHRPRLPAASSTQMSSLDPCPYRQRLTTEAPMS